MVTVISGVVVIKTLLECLDERPPQWKKFLDLHIAAGEF